MYRTDIMDELSSMKIGSSIYQPYSKTLVTILHCTWSLTAISEWLEYIWKDFKIQLSALLVQHSKIFYCDMGSVGSLQLQPSYNWIKRILWINKDFVSQDFPSRKHWQLLSYSTHEQAALYLSWSKNLEDMTWLVYELLCILMILITFQPTQT